MASRGREISFFWNKLSENAQWYTETYIVVTYDEVSLERFFFISKFSF